MQGLLMRIMFMY